MRRVATSSLVVGLSCLPYPVYRVVIGLPATVCNTAYWNHLLPFSSSYISPIGLEMLLRAAASPNQGMGNRVSPILYLRAFPIPDNTCSTDFSNSSDKTVENISFFFAEVILPPSAYKRYIVFICLSGSTDSGSVSYTTTTKRTISLARAAQRP